MKTYPTNKLRKSSLAVSNPYHRLAIVAESDNKATLVFSVVNIHSPYHTHTVGWNPTGVGDMGGRERKRCFWVVCGRDWRGWASSVWRSYMDSGPASRGGLEG